MIKSLTVSRPALFQLFRYGVVGLATNFVGYLVYLLVTLWVEPKLAVTALYPVGVLVAYFAHARYSFSYRHGKRAALARYLVAQAIGYGVNVLLLYVFSDRLRYPHQAVQAVAIFAVAGVLFLLMRYFVFPAAERA